MQSSALIEEDLVFTIDDTRSDEESPLLHTNRTANIASFIVHEACRNFYKDFKSRWIPSSFIEFYFEEYKRYGFLSEKFLIPFFKIYKNIDIPALVNHYYHCQYNVIVAKRKTRSDMFYLIEKNYYLDCNIADNDILGIFDPDLYKDLGLIANHLSSSDELVTINEKYQYFMLKKYILKTDNNKEIKKAQKIALKKIEEENKLESQQTVLVGTQTKLPSQKGKVIKVLFPKLSLPSPYPILLDKSRINSEHRARHFLRTDKQVKLMNNYKINGVKYHISFIEKRKAAKKPAKRKFDFDF